MKILIDEDTLKEIFYMLTRSTLIINDADVVQMTKLVKMATLKLADLLDEIEQQKETTKQDNLLWNKNNLLIGQCARCGGNLTANHKCPEWVK